MTRTEEHENNNQRGRNMSNNPYAAPKAAVSDIEVAQEYQEIRMWSPSGRIGRLRYLAYSTGAYLLAGVTIGLLGTILDPSLAGVVLVVAYVVAVVFVIIATIKRSHDMDWNGWTCLLTIIPLVALIWVFKPGSEGANGYGAPPPPNTTGVKILGLLLPILAVVGVIAAIAIPAYADYTNRAGM
jgi:uncharacterized membrane protein YhaH (DUF805 family)